MTEGSDAELRASLHEELGFYPANLDDESIAGYRRESVDDKSGTPASSANTAGLGVVTTTSFVTCENRRGSSAVNQIIKGGRRSARRDH